MNSINFFIFKIIHIFYVRTFSWDQKHSLCLWFLGLYRHWWGCERQFGARREQRWRSEEPYRAGRKPALWRLVSPEKTRGRGRGAESDRRNHCRGSGSRRRSDCRIFPPLICKEKGRGWKRWLEDEDLLRCVGTWNALVVWGTWKCFGYIDGSVHIWARFLTLIIIDIFKTIYLYGIA